MGSNAWLDPEKRREKVKRLRRINREDHERQRRSREWHGRWSERSVLNPVIQFLLGYAFFYLLYRKGVFPNSWNPVLDPVFAVLDIVVDVAMDYIIYYL